MMLVFCFYQCCLTGLHTFVPINKPELCFFVCEGCDDKREVPREDSFQTHKNVDQCNGGIYGLNSNK